MCLDSIRRVIKNPSQKQYAAWKVFELFEGEGDQLHFPYRSLNGQNRVDYGKWLKARQTQLHARSGDTYISGFHVYRTKAGAEWLRANMIPTAVVRRVAVRGVSYVGKQSYGVTLVAQEMYVKPNGV